MSWVRAEDLKSVKSVLLTEVIMLRGTGRPDDPHRDVTLLFDDEGRCVAERDPVYPTPWYSPVQRNKQDVEKAYSTGEPA